MVERETSHEIDAVAADWAARVDRAPLSGAQQAELDSWLAGDTRRLGAYAKARAVFAHVRRAKALGPDFNPADFPPTSVELERRSTPPSRRRFLSFSGAAAAAAGVTVTAGVAFQMRNPRYGTKLGEVRLVPLTDGSSVTLNTASQIAVDYTEHRRGIRLIEGEALFDVAKDPARPFVVDAGDTEVRAIGTSFTVRRLPDRPTEILVRQGVVNVKRRGAGMPPIRVSANTRALAAGDAALEAVAVAPAQVTRELAWREGMLSFEDVRLDQAAAEFSRYNDTRIVIDDPSIAAETVTGLFSANNPAGFARAVATTLDLHAEATPGEVRLRR